MVLNKHLKVVSSSVRVKCTNAVLCAGNRVVYSNGQRVSLTVAEHHASMEQLAKLDITHKLAQYYGRPLGDLYMDM